MYIKNSKGTIIINFDHFDGVRAEKYDDSVWRLNLFKAEGWKGFSRLEKCPFCIGTFGREQAERIIGEIEESLKNSETVYVLPEPEERA